jgi:hypothetical protein
MGMDFYILMVIFDSKLRNAAFAFETDSRMQKNFTVEYQTTFFRKLYSSTLEWKLKENYDSYRHTNVTISNFVRFGCVRITGV